ncbi:MAG: pyridoxine 5'-phosphate synthase [Cytophagales bacterium]|jgi:pyridoxine 5-phosphate synthase|nr:pyridoxine 5'-phosphate synthase [Cytophagales bacterium]PDH42407.1 MAG: pyridoxine 5'-phosphate synthase [Rhodothermaeota bacterium MED-G19]
MKTRLSVNVNKIATLRNARGGNNPNIIELVKKIESYGADGITVHPRTDERHITLQDVYDISKVVKTDYNIEGYPDVRFLNIINDIKPEQVTLVPDAPDVITSNRGWKESDLNMDIKSIILSIKRLGSKVSLFIEPSISMINFALDYDVDRIELYTGDYARLYGDNENKIIDKYISVSEYAQKNGIEVNAGHDLDLENLLFFKRSIPNLYEVSIGHALICDSLIYGLEKTIKRYLEQLK